LQRAVGARRDEMPSIRHGKNGALQIRPGGIEKFLPGKDRMPLSPGREAANRKPERARVETGPGARSPRGRRLAFTPGSWAPVADRPPREKGALP